MMPIMSLRDLAARIGRPIDQLRDIAANISKHYDHKISKQASGKVRHLRVPKAELRALQRRINKNILAPIAMEETVHGGVKGRSPRTNATQHIAQECVINLDVRDFFPSIRHRVVYRMFRHELGFGRDVARLLTHLTTIDAQLPQGSPTSTAIANLVLRVPLDKPLEMYALSIGAASSRFVDDITLSGTNPRELINPIARALSGRRLKLYRRKAHAHPRPKLRITPRHRKQEVTGLTVNSKRGPSVPRNYRDAVKAAIFQARGTIDPTVRNAAIRSLRGRIAYVRQHNPGTAARLERGLAALHASVLSQL